jgi:hypothetical protein
VYACQLGEYIVLSCLFAKKSESNKQKDTDQLTPTIQFFLEKNKGNTELDNYERDAIAYIGNRKPTTPPDFYFAQKLSNSNSQGRGIISSDMGSSLLENYEKEATEYVKQFNSSNTFSKK